MSTFTAHGVHHLISKSPVTRLTVTSVDIQQRQWDLDFTFLNKSTCLLSMTSKITTDKWINIETDSLIPSSSRSRWPHGRRCGCVATRLLGLRVQILPEALMPVPCAGCVLWGRGPCDGPIPHPQKSYWVCMCVCVCVNVIKGTVTLNTYNV